MGALKWGLRILVLNCAQLPTSVVIATKIPLQKRPKGHKCAQLQTIAHECLKPPFG